MVEGRMFADGVCDVPGNVKKVVLDLVIRFVADEGLSHRTRDG